MGHKVHPLGFRLGVVKGWQSLWFAERDYKDIYAEDVLIRDTINKELANAAVSKIEIERAAADQIMVRVHTAKPGIVIGRSGEKVDRLRALLEKKTRKRRVRMDIHEIRQPELDAVLVARSIAEQLEKRVSFRRAMKQAVQKAMRANAKGIKIIVGGRLGGAEIARSEKEVEGKVPLHTIRADIDYGLAEARTTFGVIGIKVWIYKGDILPSRRREGADVQGAEAAQPTFTPPGERRDRRRDGGRGGERSQRPRGDRGDRGERGERPPRGERPQGDRPPRGERPQGDRPPRGERPQGERPPRGPRPERSERAERPEQAPEATGTITPAVETTPPPTPPATDTGTAQSEERES